MAELMIQGLVREFGAHRVLHEIDLTVKDGEFLTLLGPSGCGKSTTLAAVAGLDQPDGGRIALGTRVFFDAGTRTFVPPERRNIGLVFQSYALWPHMTVRENLDLPLKLRKLGKKERADRIAEALDLVEMSPFADRHPHALSGGQQQRVALARTLVYQPDLLLLDEPLSNLDAKLRERARVWLRHLQQRLGVTTIYVTHDQEEALALSDRIAVMNQGHIVQLGDPHTIYNTPVDPFIADFIGSSNFLSGTVAARGEGVVTITLVGGAQLTVESARLFQPGDAVSLSVRPERIEILEPSSPIAENILQAQIEEVTFLGSHHVVQASSGGAQFRVESRGMPPAGDVRVHIPRDAAIVFPASVSQ